MDRLRALMAVSCVVVALCAPAPTAAQERITVSGTLVDARGEPLAGWAVLTDESGFPPPLLAFTADDGTFTFQTDPFADVLVFDGGDWAFATSNEVTFDEDRVLDVRAPLDDLAIRVVDELGEPIARRLITLAAAGAVLDQELVPGAGPTEVRSPFNTDGPAVWTDDNGEASIDAPVGDAVGTIVLTTGAGPWDPQPFEFSLDRAVPLVYELALTQFVEIEVVGADGLPRPDVLVDLRSSVSPRGRGVTDATGRTSIRLGRGPYSVTMSAGELSVLTEGEPLVRDGVGPLQLTLPPVDSRRLRVVDGNGVPIEGARVFFFLRGADGPEVAPGLGPSSSFVSTGEYTDEDGIVDQSFFIAGQYSPTVRAGRPGGNFVANETVPVDIEDPECCTFVFRSHEGTVADLRGAPLAGVEIEVRPATNDDPPGAITRTDADGRFDLTYDGGTFDVFVRSGDPDERLPREFEFVDYAAPITQGRTDGIRLRGIDVPVRVVDHLGQPVASAVIEGCGDAADSPKVAAFRDMEGSFCDGAVSDTSGNATLTAFPTDSLGVTVTAPGRPDLEPQSAQVEVQFTSAVDEVLVVLSPPTLTPGVVSVVEGDSWFRFAQLPVQLSSPASATVQVRWEVVGIEGVAGAATPWVDLAGLRGRVTFRKGQDTAYVPVVVFGDRQVEEPLLGGEWGFVRFSEVTGPARLDTESFFGNGVVVIVDDDAAEE